jgi:hypothetical protein
MASVAFAHDGAVGAEARKGLVERHQLRVVQHHRDKT